MALHTAIRILKKYYITVFKNVQLVKANLVHSIIRIKEKEVLLPQNDKNGIF